MRKTLRQAGVALRADPPLPADWRTGLAPATVAALQAYVRDLGHRQQVAWRQLHQTALETTPAAYVFATPAVYETALQSASPPESLLDVARRLDLDVSRVLLQDLTGYLGRRYAYDDVRTATPLTLLVDEFSNVAYPLFVEALNKAGGAQARFVLAMQSLADPEAAMGRERARQVFDNLNTKLWFRVADPRTAEEATRGLGLCTVRLPEEGVGLSYGGLGGLVGKIDRRLKQQQVPLLRPEWLMALPRGEAVVRLQGEVWKLRVPLLDPPPPDVLTPLGLTDLVASSGAAGRPD